MGATRVAALDCGTNSVKILIADIDREAGTSSEVLRDLEMVRLGEGVDRSGRLSTAALNRLFTALDGYAGLIEEHGATRTRMCATSAARDAENSEEFMSGVEERLGVRPEVVDGRAEAELSFRGATRPLAGGVAGDVAGPYLVVDIGGGSTELILGEPDGTVLSCDSLDVGSVRMTERHLATDPPTKAEIEAAKADVDAALDATDVDLSAAQAMIGVAGTITTMAAAVLDLATYDRTLIDHAVLRTEAVQGAASLMLSRTIEERRALGYMHTGRADVIGAGALILDRVLRRTGVDSMLVSESDLLDEIAWSLA